MGAGDKAISATLLEVISMYAATLMKGKALMMESEVAYGILKKYFDRLTKRNRPSFIEKHTVKHRNKLILRHDGTHLLPVAASKKEEVYKALKQLLQHDAHFANMKHEDAAFSSRRRRTLHVLRFP